MHRADRGRGPLHRAASPPDRFATSMSSLTHGTVVCSPLSSPSIKEVDGRSYHLVHHIFSLSRGKPSPCSPPASHRLRPPFINSSCIEFLHDLTLLLPRFCSSGSTPPASTSDHNATVCHLPVRAHLRAAHHR
jgi:hypothetical protein